MTRTSSGRSPFSVPSRKSSSMAVRKAASVLPEPVGAAMSVCSPRRMALQPSDWAAVGSPKRPSHQRLRTGWKSWGSKPIFSQIGPASGAAHHHFFPSQAALPQRPDDLVGDILGHFHQREAIGGLDLADEGARHAPFLGDGADEIL